MTLDDLPDSALVPWGWAKRTLGNVALQAEPRRMVDSTRAREILGLPERAARRFHARCERAQAQGRTPPVHVGRKGAAEHSGLLFDEEDCWAYRRAKGAVQVVAAESDGDEAAAGEAIADALFRAEYGGHG